MSTIKAAVELATRAEIARRTVALFRSSGALPDGHVLLKSLAPVLRLLAVTILAAGLAACGPASTSSPAASVSGPVPVSPVEGVITNVVSAGLDQVTAFTIRTGEGKLLEFRIGDLENGDEFPPGHLTEHQATSDPIRIYFTVDGAALVATRLEDAGG